MLMTVVMPHRKFLESKVQGLKDLEDQKLLYRENALRDARQGALGVTGQIILASVLCSDWELYDY